MEITSIAWLVVGASAALVYLDAAAHRIGKIEGDKSFTNISAGAWGVCVLLIWVVGVPLYLANRSRLVDRAKEQPRDSGMRTAKASALAAVPVTIAVSAFAGSSLPACNDAVVADLVRSILGERLPNMEFRLSSYGEVAAESVRERRVCRVQVESQFGIEWLQFTVEPHENGQIFVRILGR